MCLREVERDHEGTVDCNRQGELQFDSLFVRYLELPPEWKQAAIASLEHIRCSTDTGKLNI